jgi:steroid delta-isomerase-like uncharacterized protein
MLMHGGVDQGLRERREAIVNEHAAAENRHDVEATVATFGHARYEVMPLGEPSDGAAAVRELLQGLIDGFPDFNADVQRMHHADDAVICEVRMSGTHRGPWAGVAATGRRIDLPLACIFDFEEDRLVCEKLFFDFATLLRQLGALPEPAEA